jgi:cytochrome c oxidase subunit 2
VELLRRILFLPRGASSIALEIDLLHTLVITVTMIGSTGVFVAALWSMWRYHRTRGRTTTEVIRASFAFEATTIGGLLALFILWWVIGYEQYQGMRAVPRGAVDVHVVAKQWMWQFADESGRRSQSVIVVPRGQPMRLVMTSRDVIHSFFVPAFRVKQDVLPGIYTELWFQADEAGTFDIFCTEYCGLQHSRMRGSVVVLEPWDYARYLEGAAVPSVIDAEGGAPPPPVDDLVAAGESVAARMGCLACHTVTGEPHIAPSWRGLYGSTVELEGGRRVRADEAYLTESMMEPERQVVRGFPAVMPSYRGILDASDAAALVEYIRSVREPAREPPPVELPPVELPPVETVEAPTVERTP